jgi:hypothetical protein
LTTKYDGKAQELAKKEMQPSGGISDFVLSWLQPLKRSGLLV